jgi:predicted DNA-binding transcriptional regulator YafY
MPAPFSQPDDSQPTPPQGEPGPLGNQPASRWLRVMAIDRRLHSAAPPPTFEELKDRVMRELDLPRLGDRTLRDDLRFMREQFDIRLPAEAGADGKYRYRYEDPNFSIFLPLVHDDYEGLQLAQALLYKLRSSGLLQPFEHALQQLHTATRLGETDTNFRELLLPEEAPETHGLTHMPELVRAIRAARPVSFDYTRFDRPTHKRHTVQPLLLKEFRHRWYLIAWYPAMQNYSVFGLDRFAGPPEVDEEDANIFAPSEKRREAHQLFDQVYGITIKPFQAPDRVVLCCTPTQARYLRSVPLHSSQAVLQEEADCVWIALTLVPTTEFIMRLMGFGDGVRVAEPQWLAEELESKLQSALAQYHRARRERPPAAGDGAAPGDTTTPDAAPDSDPGPSPNEADALPW